ncbi:hypothetical protein Tco_0365508 [Tanacetum coccineum]
MDAFRVLMTQFQTFIKEQYYFVDFDDLMISKYFLAYTRTKVQQFCNTLIQHMESVKKSIDERAQHKRHYDRRVNKRLIQTQESKVISSKAVDVDLVVMESSRAESGKQDTSSSSGNYLTHAVDADIRPVNDQVPFAKVHLTAQHIVLANEQQHSVQSKPSYDTHLLENIDSNITPDSTNICHMGGEIIQDAEQYQVKSPLLNTKLFKSKEMIKKEKYNELSHRFLLLKKHCISLELEIQQKDASFQSNKLGKNQDAPDVKEASNEAKVKNDIDLIETINIELEHNVAKLLATNEQLHKENEHLKQTYKELYDLIKKTRIQNKDNSDSLISQINQKSVKNADLKARIQEKVFANATLKNELRKLKGNNVDTKFAKASILGKPPLQPSRNHLVVRQPNAFKSERPRISIPREMPSARTHHTPNACTPKPRSNNQTFRNWPASKSSNVKLTIVQKFLKEVNSHAKIQSLKSRNSIKLVGKKSNANKPERPIFKGHRLSRNKSSALHEKTSPRSCLRWKPTGIIFKTVGLRWVPTGKIFTDSTTKVDSEPQNGLNDDITNPYECDQTLNTNISETRGSRKSNVMNMNRWHLQTTLQAPLLKEKKSVRFSALYLQKKRNLHNIRVIPKYHNEDGNPARANIKQALGLHKDGDADTSFQQSQVHSHMLILKTQ